MSRPPQERGPTQPPNVVEQRFEAYRQAARQQIDLQRKQVQQYFETCLDVGMQRFAMMVELYRGNPPAQRIHYARWELNQLRRVAARQDVNLPYAIQLVNGQWSIVRTEEPPNPQQAPQGTPNQPQNPNQPPQNPNQPAPTHERIDPVQQALTGVNTRHTTLFNGTTQTTGGTTNLTLTLRNDLSPQVVLSELQPLLPGRTITISGNSLVIPGITQADLQQINPAPLRESNRYQSIPRSGQWERGDRVTQGERTSSYRIGAGRIMYDSRSDGTIHSFEDGQWRNVLERRNIASGSQEGQQYLLTLIRSGDMRFVRIATGRPNCTYAIDPTTKDLIERKVEAVRTTYRRFSIATRTWRTMERYDALR